MEIQTYLENIIDWLLSEGLQWIITSGLKILLIIILMLISLRIARIFSKKIFSVFQKEESDIESQKRIDTLSSVLRYIITITIVSLSLVIILSELGVQIGPILAAAGVLGLAIGFGAQGLVQDLISGFFYFI